MWKSQSDFFLTKNVQASVQAFLFTNLINLYIHIYQIEKILILFILLQCLREWIHFLNEMFKQKLLL